MALVQKKSGLWKFAVIDLSNSYLLIVPEGITWKVPDKNPFDSITPLTKFAKW